MSTTPSTAPSTNLDNYGPVPTYWQLMVSELLKQGAPERYSRTIPTEAGRSEIKTDLLRSAEGDDIRQVDKFTPIGGKQPAQSTCTIRFKLEEGVRTFKLWSGDREIKNPLEASKEFSRIMRNIQESVAKA